MIAKWSNLHTAIEKVADNSYARVSLVTVEVPDASLTATVRIPAGTTDITAYLQASQDLKSLVTRAQDKAKSTQFDITLEAQK
ncbi:MAG: hypothetical protein KAU10_07600 [Dehalococcoidia bacterium]|nr:hypothetical protein [Dehalococcoidia bacterium]